MSTSQAPQELNSSLQPQLELEELDLAVIVTVLINWNLGVMMEGNPNICM